MSDDCRVRLQILHPALGKSIPLPQQMSADAAGFDVYAVNDAPLTIGMGEYYLVPLGFALHIPSGFEAQMRPRSGLSVQHGLTLLNAPGTIDADYRGEVKVILINFGPKAYQLLPGTRVAQMVFARVVAVQWQIDEQLAATARGMGGFGSTGER